MEGKVWVQGKFGVKCKGDFLTIVKLIYNRKTCLIKYSTPLKVVVPSLLKILALPA